MMQKDEELLLESWLLYYGYLFGFENLTVFDNGSSSLRVLDTLNRFQAAGVTIIRDYTTQQDWLRKGEIFASIIRDWDKIGNYDFAIPLDCDEFLALFTNDGLTCGRNAIHAYLDTLIGRPEVLSLNLSNFNVPGRPGWFWPTRGSKRFFSADSIATLDHGFHIATSRKSDHQIPTRLTHLHLHHKPYEILLQHARSKLQPFVDVTNPEVLLAFTGPGSHLVRHFRQTEAEYIKQFEMYITFGYSGLSATLTALGHNSDLFTVTDVTFKPSIAERHITVRLPATDNQAARVFLFDADAYLKEHAGVAAQRGVCALEHYLLFGFNEGRIVFEVKDTPSERPFVWPELT